MAVPVQPGTDSRWAFTRRVIAVWFVIVAVESLHGTARRFLLEPLVGDLPARQISVFTGSAVIVAVAFVFVRWLKGSRATDFLVAGFIWVALTLIFEVFLGRAVLGMSWERIFSDYDLARGGLMPLGLMFMLFAPLAAAWLTDEI